MIKTQKESLEAELEMARDELAGIEAGQLSGRLGRKAQVRATIERLEAELAAMRSRYGFEARVNGQWSREAAGDTDDSALLDTLAEAQAELPRLVEVLGADEDDVRIVQVHVDPTVPPHMWRTTPMS